MVASAVRDKVLVVERAESVAGTVGGKAGALDANVVACAGAVSGKKVLGEIGVEKTNVVESAVSGKVLVAGATDVVAGAVSGKVLGVVGEKNVVAGAESGKILGMVGAESAKAASGAARGEDDAVALVAGAHGEGEEDGCSLGRDEVEGGESAAALSVRSNP